jgi:hypothetical protein
VPGAAPAAHLSAPVRRILAVALALGAASDGLFYNQRAGISVFLFHALLVGAGVVLGRRDGARMQRANLWLLIPLGFFAAMIAVRANDFLTLMNGALVAGLLGLLAYYYAAERIADLGLPGYPVVLATVARHILLEPRGPVSVAGRQATAQGPHLRLAGPLARGALVALPVLAVFGLLLTSADSFFARAVGDLLSFKSLKDLPESIWRGVQVLAVSWLVAGGLLYALRVRGARAATARLVPPGRITATHHLGFVESMTVMGLVNVLFGGFAWVQFTYLFSGQAARTLQYEAYREYVRHGFGELLVVSVLTMVLILGLRWATWQETPRETRLLNVFSTLLIGFAFIMLASALKRMVDWESVQYYINTPLRLYVRWFIFWLGVDFAWLLGTLWLRPARFAIGALAVVLAFCATVNVINPDADVAAANLSRNDELSTRYLDLLSDDAVPALVAGLNDSVTPVQRDLRLHLARRLARMEGDPSWQTLPAFHFARNRAYHLLTDLRQAGTIVKLTPIRPDDWNER